MQLQPGLLVRAGPLIRRLPAESSPGSLRPLRGLLCLLLLALPVSAKNEKTKERTEDAKSAVAGRDPAAFADARELYQSKRTELSVREGTAWLQELRSSSGRGRVWSAEIWGLLDRMKSKRLPNGLTDSLVGVADKFVFSATDTSSPVDIEARRHLVAADKLYRARRFDSAAAAFRKTLRSCPAHWDAINNLALTEMHRNNDLAALFLLTVIRRNNPKYLGAAINLSVCLERLGRGENAFEIADSSASNGVRNPMAQYNLAWFQLSRDDSKEAKRTLSTALSGDLDYPAAKRLSVLADYESGKGLDSSGRALFTPVQIRRSSIDGRPMKRLAPAYEYPPGSMVAPAEAPKPQPDAGKSEGARISLVGKWSEKWGSVFNIMNIVVRLVDSKPKVTMNGAFVTGERYEGRTLVFEAQMMSTGLKFVYKATPRDGRIDLDVLRLSDQTHFEGRLF